MKQIGWHVIAPFVIGFGLGVAFCTGLCILDVGGIWSLADAADAKLDLALEFAWFASLFGILSCATHHAMGLVWDR